MPCGQQSGNHNQQWLNRRKNWTIFSPSHPLFSISTKHRKQSLHPTHSASSPSQHSTTITTTMQSDPNPETQRPQQPNPNPQPNPRPMKFQLTMLGESGMFFPFTRLEIVRIVESMLYVNRGWFSISILSFTWSPTQPCFPPFSPQPSLHRPPLPNYPTSHLIPQ